MPSIEKIAAEQSNRCYYCDNPMIRHQHINGEPIPRDAMTKDHYIARVYGGATTPENMVAACSQCNWIRGSLDAETFYRVIQGWFKQDEILHERWNEISREEFVYFKRESERINKLKWKREIKKCVGAIAVCAIVPMPLPPHLKRA